jgi:Glycosyl transferase family 11
MGNAPTPLVAAKSWLLEALRAGPNEVVWSPDIKMGLGNFLYLWLAADRVNRRGGHAHVRIVAGMKDWFEDFPQVASDLVIEQTAVGLRDRRVLGFHQGFGENFSIADLELFVRDYILSGPLLASPVDCDPSHVVVNVRRGDYYSVERFRAIYAFNIVAYVQQAIREAATDQPISGISIVSDDIDWCRDALGWLAKVAPLDFANGSSTPQENFRQLATARRLILANSTFSYWAGYVSNVIHVDNHAQVIAPWFHARLACGDRAYQLDPRWTIIKDLPGGWTTG